MRLNLNNKYIVVRFISQEDHTLTQVAPVSPCWSPEILHAYLQILI